MANTRKPRSDSAEAQQKRAQMVDRRIEPPIDLTEEETEVFNSLIEGLPADEWDRHNIRMAARLARLEVYLEFLLDQAIDEGPTSFNARGTQSMNPVHSAMTQTASTVKMLRGSLGLNVSQKGTKAGKDAKQAKDRDARKKLQAVGGKDLLA